MRMYLINYKDLKKRRVCRLSVSCGLKLNVIEPISWIFRKGGVSLKVITCTITIVNMYIDLQLCYMRGGTS